MDKGVVQRKLSRGKSVQTARSIFSRKSVKKADDQSINTPSDDQPTPNASNEKEHQKHASEDNGRPRSLFPSRSIIPDPLNELPTWYTQAAEDGPATTPQFRSRYPMHNPVGPRFYKNWHLSPSQLENRPPSFFSPSFPPMASGADRGQDSKLPGPSRTPSGSPLPTPTSSQTRIHDVRVRTRKVSQTAHDNVDMLDGTDPWGTNWHHQSPYDVGNERVTPESASESPTTSRPRRMSLTTGSHHKTVTPSPLSQSTSAVHLASEPVAAYIPRRLSKNRKPFHDLFAHGNSNSSKRTSEPPALMNPPARPLKRGSSIGPSLSSGAPSVTDKKEKRGSILGRLAKRFSVMRKPDQNRSSAKVGSIETHSVMNGRPSIDTLPAPSSRTTPSPQKPPLHHTKSSEVPRRVPPPALRDELPTPPTENDTTTRDKDAVSISSLEEPFPIGKLTIANPDEPGPLTPAEVITPLPPLPQPSGTGVEGSLVVGVLDVPLSSSPPPMDIPDTPIHHRLSTILSVDAPIPSPSPPLPDLPPPTPAFIPKALSEPSLPPTPQETRPPSPSEAPMPASPTMSNGTRARNALSYAMSPSSLSAFEVSLPSTNDLPLSRASIVVNPPTPHPPTILIPSPAHSAPLPSPEQVLQINGDVSTHRDSSLAKKEGSQRMKGSSSSTKSRRTETFKLIRSPSGNVHTVGETFVAEGEHWEVVESPVDSKKTRKERSKGSEAEATPSRKESKKADRGSADDSSDKQKEKGRDRDRHRKSVNGRSSGEHAGRSSTYSEADTIRQSTAERRRSSTKERNRDSGIDVMRSTRTPVTPPMPANKVVLSRHPSRRERRTSGSATRPSSELQSAADINTLKAKEAWDLERLWKGRSMMYGPDGTTVISTRPTIGSDSRPSTIMSHDLHRATSIPSVGDLQRASTMPATHGSSHTYFMVQTPPSGASSHEHIPIPSVQQSTRSTTTRDHHKLYRSFPDSVPFPSGSSSSNPLPNPLPEPPRLSAYQASPLPSSLAGPGDGPSSPDYWTKYAGVTTNTNH